MVVGVTGASGHIGNVLCRQLLQRGYQVKALYHKDREPLKDLEDLSTIELVQGDMLNLQHVEEFVSGCNVIMNCAAIISIFGDPTNIVFKTNTEGPRNLVRACISNGKKIKIIHISSTHAVHELPHDTPYDETRPYKQKSDFAYDYSKACGEQIVLEAIQKGKLDGCILRPSSVVGPHDFKPSEIGKALIDFYNEKIPILPPGGYNFVDVRDVANTIINSIERSKNGEIYLLSGKYYSLKNLSHIINHVTGKKTPSVVLPFWVMRLFLPFVKFYGLIRKAAPVFTIEAITALRRGHPNMVNQKACNELGHSCRPLDETLCDFYDWYKSANADREKIKGSVT